MSKIGYDALRLGILLAIGQTERYAVYTEIMNLMVPITCWERADLLALRYILFPFVLAIYLGHPGFQIIDIQLYFITRSECNVYQM